MDTYEVAESFVIFVREELVYLWGQLWDAYQHYLDGFWLGQHPVAWNEGDDEHEPQWSGRCEGLAERIRAATELVGPISWRDVPITALAEGWFAWANEYAEISDPNLPDEDGMEHCRQYVADEQARARLMGRGQ